MLEKALNSGKEMKKIFMLSEILLMLALSSCATLKQKQLSQELMNQDKERGITVKFIDIDSLRFNKEEDKIKDFKYRSLMDIIKELSIGLPNYTFVVEKSKGLAKHLAEINDTVFDIYIPEKVPFSLHRFTIPEIADHYKEMDRDSFYNFVRNNKLYISMTGFYFEKLSIFDIALFSVRLHKKALDMNEKYLSMLVYVKDINETFMFKYMDGLLRDINVYEGRLVDNNEEKTSDIFVSILSAENSPLSDLKNALYTYFSKNFLKKKEDNKDIVNNFEKEGFDNDEDNEIDIEEIVRQEFSKRSNEEIDKNESELKKEIRKGKVRKGIYHLSNEEKQYFLEHGRNYLSKYKMTDGFYAIRYYNGKRDYHKAIDLIPRIASDHNSYYIKPFLEGRVKRVGYNHIAGKYVIIEHTFMGDTFYSLYAHFSRIMVRRHQKVYKSTILGMMGATGRTQGKTGIHLHFALYKKLGKRKVFVNIERLLKEKYVYNKKRVYKNKNF